MPLISRAGFDAFPMGLDVDVTHAERVFPELKQLQGVDQAVWSIQNVFFGALSKAAPPDAVQIVHDWQPDVVLHELPRGKEGRLALRVIQLDRYRRRRSAAVAEL